MGKVKLSDQQNKAVAGVVERMRAGEPVTRLFGYAGAGKTTIAKEIASQLTGEAPSSSDGYQLTSAGSGRVLFGAFTGKAALVLTRKECPATTLHSLIYRPAGDAKELIRQLKAKLESGDLSREEAREVKERLAKARKEAASPGFILKEDSELFGSRGLIVDEVSMVDEKMGADLEGFGAPILALGDPFQLPPVGGGGYFTEVGVDGCDFMLDEVHRQKEGSEVLDLATAIREGKNINGMPGVFHGRGVKDWMDYDQVIVGTNRTRWSKNLGMREAYGFHSDGEVEAGEKIIVLANNTDMGVFNGLMLYVQSVRDHEMDPDKLWVGVRCDCEGMVEGTGEAEACVTCGFRPRELVMWAWGFRGSKGEQELKDMPMGQSRQAVHATYGYAITCHKSQGSQWDRVLVVDESRVFARSGKEMGARWLYTAVTRAANDVLVIR